ncbi:hypothetical protein [Leifsonia sp. P73]|uniref:hypothetical protein n=1 Tax=Leifsonia sp. P73 TaxID=3423959 RepID=UPI003DA52611
MLIDERRILDTVRAQVLDLVPGIRATVLRSADKQWAWMLQVSASGSLPRHLYWGSSQWWATQFHAFGGLPPVSVVEPIASATDEKQAVDRGVVVALAAAGSSALDGVNHISGESDRDNSRDRSALVTFGAALNALEKIQDSGAADAETRSLARALRGEWLITRLDDLQG